MKTYDSVLVFVCSIYFLQVENKRILFWGYYFATFTRLKFIQMTNIIWVIWYGSYHRFIAEYTQLLLSISISSLNRLHGEVTAHSANYLDLSNWPAFDIFSALKIGCKLQLTTCKERRSPSYPIPTIPQKAFEGGPSQCRYFFFQIVIVRIPDLTLAESNWWKIGTILQKDKNIKSDKGFWNSFSNKSPQQKCFFSLKLY